MTKGTCTHRLEYTCGSNEKCTHIRLQKHNYSQFNSRRLGRLADRIGPHAIVRVTAPSIHLVTLPLGGWQPHPQLDLVLPTCVFTQMAVTFQLTSSLPSACPVSHHPGVSQYLGYKNGYVIISGYIYIYE